MNDREIEVLNGKLRMLRGATIQARLELQCPAERTLGAMLSSQLMLPSSEAAEQIVGKLLAFSYPGLSLQRHPRGERGFPDHSLQGHYIELKSWKAGRGRTRGWVGPKFETLREAMLSEDMDYLSAIYIDCSFGVSEDGDSKILDCRAGRLWDFCGGALSKKAAGVFLIPQGGDSGVSPKSFAAKLIESTRGKGLSGLPKECSMVSMLNRAMEH